MAHLEPNAARLSPCFRFRRVGSLPFTFAARLYTSPHLGALQHICNRYRHAAVYLNTTQWCAGYITSLFCFARPAHSPRHPIQRHKFSHEYQRNCMRLRYRVVCLPGCLPIATARAITAACYSIQTFHLPKVGTPDDSQVHQALSSRVYSL